MVCSGSVAENPLLLQQGASSFGAGPQNSGMKIPAKDCKGHPMSGLGTLVRKCLFMVSTEASVRNSEGGKDEILNVAFYAHTALRSQNPKALALIQ